MQDCDRDSDDKSVFRQSTNMDEPPLRNNFNACSHTLTLCFRHTSQAASTGLSLGLESIGLEAKAGLGCAGRRRRLEGPAADGGVWSSVIGYRKLAC
jgi:hypothetical protein